MLRETRIFPQTCRVGYPCIAVRQFVGIRERPAERSSGTRGKGNVRSIHRYGSPQFLFGSSPSSRCSRSKVVPNNSVQ